MAYSHKVRLVSASPAPVLTAARQYCLPMLSEVVARTRTCFAIRTVGRRANSSSSFAIRRHLSRRSSVGASGLSWFYFSLKQRKIGCGNVGISRSPLDFQVAVGTGLWFPQRRHFHSRPCRAFLQELRFAIGLITDQERGVDGLECRSSTLPGHRSHGRVLVAPATASSHGWRNCGAAPNSGRTRHAPPRSRLASAA